MPNIIYEKVKKMSLTDLQQMINDYEELEKRGRIGDCLLRKTAQNYIKEYDVPGYTVVRIMKDFAFESLRFFYKVSHFHTRMMLNTEA